MRWFRNKSMDGAVLEKVFELVQKDEEREVRLKKAERRIKLLEAELKRVKAVQNITTKKVRNYILDEQETERRASMPPSQDEINKELREKYGAALDE